MVAIFAVPVANQISWRFAIRGGFPQLLGDPRIGRMGSDSKVNDTSRAKFDDEERVDLPEEHVDHREKVTGPDQLGVIPDES